MLIGGGGKALVPHRIGYHDVKLPQPSVCVLKGRAGHSIAQGDFCFHVVDEGVHAGHGESGGIGLLAVKFQRRNFVGWGRNALRADRRNALRPYRWSLAMLTLAVRAAFTR